VDRALENLQEVIPAAQQIGHPGSILGQGQLVSIYLSLGDPDRARRAAQQALEAAPGFPPFRPSALVSLARIDLEAGDLASAARHMEEAWQAGFDETLFNVDTDRLITQIEVLLAGEDFSQAAGQIERLMDRLDQARARFYLPDAYLLKARWLSGEGRLDEATAAFEAARGAAEELESRVILWRILANHARLMDARGEVEKAENLRGQARRVVAWIGEHISDTELRGSFAQLAAVELSPVGKPSEVWRMAGKAGVRASSPTARTPLKKAPHPLKTSKG
jgi:hypothetical protein